jgi:hypothetical protein
LDIECPVSSLHRKEVEQMDEPHYWGRPEGQYPTMIMVATQQAPRDLLLLGVQERGTKQLQQWSGSIAGWKMFGWKTRFLHIKEMTY